MGTCCLQPILKLDYTCEFRIKSLKIWCLTQTKEPCVFRANPASKTLRALATKSWRMLWTEFSDAPHIHEASVGGLAELHKCTDPSFINVQITVVIFGGTVQQSKKKLHFASSRPCFKISCFNFEEWQYSFHPAFVFWHATFSVVWWWL